MAGISWVGTTAESSTVGSRPVAVPTTVKTPLSNTGLISTAQSYLPTTLSDSNTHTKIAVSSGRLSSSLLHGILVATHSLTIVRNRLCPLVYINCKLLRTSSHTEIHNF